MWQRFGLVNSLDAAGGAGGVVNELVSSCSSSGWADLLDIWLGCDDLVLGVKGTVALVLEVPDGSRQVQVAVDPAYMGTSCSPTMNSCKGQACAVCCAKHTHVYLPAGSTAQEGFSNPWRCFSCSRGSLTHAHSPPDDPADVRDKAAGSHDARLLLVLLGLVVEAHGLGGGPPAQHRPGVACIAAEVGAELDTAEHAGCRAGGHGGPGQRWTCAACAGAGEPLLVAGGCQGPGFWVGPDGRSVTDTSAASHTF